MTDQYDQLDGLLFGRQAACRNQNVPEVKHIQSIFREAKKSCTEMEPIWNLDKVVARWARDAGGGRAGAREVMQFTADDFVQGWVAYLNRKNRKQRWAGTFVAVAKSNRKMAICRGQEQEHDANMKADKAATHAMPAATKALCDQVAPPTDEDIMCHEWTNLSGLLKGPWMRQARVDLGDCAAIPVVHDKARLAWWRQRKANQ